MILFSSNQREKFMLGVNGFACGQKSLVAPALFSLGLMASVSSAQTKIDCSLYKVPELAAICSQFKSAHVHTDVAEHGLNALVDSWGETGGLHIIPAKAYPLSRPVRLTATQALLPAATASDGKPLFQLKAADGYSHGSEPFALLQLTGKSRAGGVSIDAESFSPSLFTGDNGSLVAIEDSDGTIELAGSVLKGEDTGKLAQLLRVDGGSSGKDILLQRNMFLADWTKTSVHSNLGDKQSLRMFGNLMTSESATHTGIVNKGGNIDLTFNDFSCNSGCKAVQLDDTPSFVITSNAFWDNISTVLTLNNSPSKQGELSSNSFKNGMVIVDKGNSPSPWFLEHNNIASMPGGAYPWTIPEPFFAYTGKGGAIAVPVGILQDVNHYVSGNDTSELQQLTPFASCKNCSSVYSLEAIRQNRPPDIPNCNCLQQGSYSEPGAIAQMVFLVTETVISIVLFVTCYKFGKKDLIKYQRLRNPT
ncbi:MAG: hypothetical protein ACR2PT_03560 [Endozoicomonas sp.]